MNESLRRKNGYGMTWPGKMWRTNQGSPPWAAGIYGLTCNSCQRKPSRSTSGGWTQKLIQAILTKNLPDPHYSIKDKKIREDVLQKFKNLEYLEVAEYLSFIKTIISTREASKGNINLQQGGREAPKRPPPPNRGLPATTPLWTRCK